MKQMKKQILKISRSRLTIMFIIVYLILQGVFMSMFQFFISFNPIEINWIPFFVYTPSLIILTIIFYVLSITRTHYEVTKKGIIYYRLNKIYEFPFTNMLYIDQIWSKKHRTLLFYDASGRRKYLTFDKEGLIFEYALKYAPLLSKEDFQARFPNVRL